MTRLSRFDADESHIVGAMIPQSQGFLPVARALLLMGLVLALSGCPFPPPLVADQPDAGLSSPPVVTNNVSPAEFRFPGPITVFADDTRFFSLTIHDEDVDELLFVRMYVDYQIDNPTNFLSDCTAVATGLTDRQATCPAAQLCDNIPGTDTESHALEVMVSDQVFLPSGDPAAAGQPAFRAVALGGTPTFRTWLMKCEASQ